MNTINEIILLDIIKQKPTTRAEFDRARTQAAGKNHISSPSNRRLLEAYQNLLKKKRIKKNKKLNPFLQKARIRNLSGIAIITSLLKPFSCPGKCIYCPTEDRMPKSYISTEPAAARAVQLNFSPYEQMQRRIDMLEKNGHICGKIEYIIKGGTWNAYPISYQYWFILESFKACNNLTRRKSILPITEKEWNNISMIEQQNAIVREQRYNETAHHRIIGITVETRPDAIVPKTIQHMRQQGCTRVELGLQATDNKILNFIHRGHTVEQFRDAIFLLRIAGFKVDLHFMPDLPSSTAIHDVEMYKQLFRDPTLRPDMVKIYPCTVIKSAELYTWFQDGRYTPYSNAELFDALIKMKYETPRYCRISRLVRDIPSNQIEAGNKITNLREELAKKIKENGYRCQCLHCREIGRHLDQIKNKVKPQLFIEQYKTVGGTEYFLTFEDSKRIAVYGFLRLRIPYCNIKREKQKEKEKNKLFDLIPEIKNAAFIRELHVYGSLVQIGTHSNKDSQHKGLGKKLMKKAEQIVKKNGFKKIAVISGVGVRGYYRKLGYRKIGTYMIKTTKK